MTKKLLHTLAGNMNDTPPIWLMRQAGRYLPEYREIRKNVGSFLEMCYTPELAAEVTLQPIRRFGFDASILFSDILVIPDALGQKVEFQSGKGPVLEALKDEKDLSKLSTERVIEHLAPVFKTLDILSKELPKETTLIGFAGSPWTVATYMVEGGSSKDFALTKKWAYKNTDNFQKLIDILVEATSLYLIEQVKHGAEVLQLFDSWAGVLPEQAFHKWIIEPNRRIISRVRKVFPNIPFIGFPRGAALYYPDFIDNTGVDAVGLDTTVPLAWAAENLQTQVPVQGNLDPVMLFAEKKELKHAVQNILHHLGSAPFIMNLGHGILPQTPIENVEYLLELVRDSRNKQVA